MTALIVTMAIIILLLCYKVLDLKRELRQDHALADAAVAKLEAALYRKNDIIHHMTDSLNEWENSNARK